MITGDQSIAKQIRYIVLDLSKFPSQHGNGDFFVVGHSEFIAIGWEGIGAYLMHAIYMYMHGMGWDIWEIPFMMPGDIK